MWNAIEVYNYSSATSNDVVKIIPVPIKFGPSDKAYLFNVQQDSGKKYYQKVPSMAVSIGSVSYNSDRATSVNELREFYDDTLEISTIDQFWQDVVPAPYDVVFNLEIYTETYDHLFQIYEQILPFFNPTTSATTQDLSEYMNKSDTFDIGSFINENKGPVEYRPTSTECGVKDPFNDWWS